MTAKQLRRLKLALTEPIEGQPLRLFDADIIEELYAEMLDPAKVAEDMRKAFERVFAKENG